MITKDTNSPNINTKAMAKKKKMTLIKGNGNPLRSQKINRNDPCPCGSNKKAKNCCGTETKYFYSKLNKQQIKEQELKEKAEQKAEKA